MSRRPALIAAGVAAAAVIIACNGPSTAPNPNRLPQPIPQAPHSTTPPPPGVQVAYHQEEQP